jgi:hypothetical protein
MVIQCKVCESIIYPTYKNPFIECECGSIAIYADYDKDENLLYDGYAWLDGEEDDWINFLGNSDIIN